MPRPTINQISLVYAEDPGTNVNTANPECAKGATERTYDLNGFDPKLDMATTNTTRNLSYTAARKAKRCYNQYPPSQDYSVFCYLDDWSQFDTRNNVDEPPISSEKGGRGADYLWQADSAYDKFVLGFAGMLGFADPTNSVLNDKMNTAAFEFGIITDKTDLAAAFEKGAMSFPDSWASVGAYINCGFPGWKSDNEEELFNQTEAQGVLGALTKLTNKRLAFSLGGWTMSWPYNELCNDQTLRYRLRDSINDFRGRFPRFTHIDLDWEYPGSAGNGIAFSPNDGHNFATLIEEIYWGCQQIGISIAISANIATLKAAKIDEQIGRLMACGVNFNLMSYDLFTLSNNGANNDLGHHTNIWQGTGTSDFSIDAAVNYLLGCGVPSNKIFVGFAGYTRNARNAEFTEITPLRGTYNTLGMSTVGSFEAGVTEWPDLLTNYLNLEGMAHAAPGQANQVQLDSTGFVLCTDTEADADFLYNPTSKLFMSIETPRTVFKKAKYVQDKGLGGLFIWTGDQDNGLLVNAAWEGLGLAPTNPNPFDMAPYYNIMGVSSKQEFDDLINNAPPIDPPGVISGLKVPREPQCVGDH
ncbi:glycosyl hydrolase family 18 protein [Yokenella regensburgei]|uniref:glycosyl hydrolase family 18 protein n=1 Tax=Yokenella regensburgei TaxID=158877 RepID=UPI003EDAE418